MTLAKDEVVIKKWDYALAKQKNEKMTETLEVTNKRVIHTSESQYEISRQEVAIDAIQGVSFKKVNRVEKDHRVALKVIGTIMIILGICLAIVFFKSKDYMFLVLCGVSLLLGWCLMQTKELRQSMFSMEIKISNVSGVNIHNSKTGINVGSSVIIVEVDKNAVMEIIDTFGAIIIENK